MLSCELSETGWIQMDFPADPPNLSDTSNPSLPHEDEISKALGLQPGSVLFLGRGRFDILCEVEPREFDPWLISSIREYEGYHFCISLG